MGKSAPIGTVRHWANGAFIKCCDAVRSNGEQIKAAWIPLPSNARLEELGRKGDRLARSISIEKDPIDGVVYLDHELDELDKLFGNNGKYKAANFKQFNGFHGIEGYSYTSNFSKLWMDKRLGQEEAIASAFQSELNPSKLRLSSEEKAAIRERIRAEFTHIEDTFNIDDAEKVVERTSNVFKNIKKGFNFEGDEKTAYDKATGSIASILKGYKPLEDVVVIKNDAVELINKTFPDNYGLTETFKKRVDETYQKYLSKYSAEIERDYLSHLKEDFHLDVFGPVDDYYDKLTAVKRLEPDTFDLKLLTSLRFSKLYKKSILGEWEPETLTALKNIEQVIVTLPNGHFLNNDSLLALGNKEFGGDSGYAYYSASDKAINLSDDAVNAIQQLGDFNGAIEIKSVISHEIGHAVSRKLGSRKSLDYRKFGVACGWSFKQEQLHATGGDKNIPRLGSNHKVPLLTNYAHKSPEEAFAEYYSMYTLNKWGINQWLKSGDISKLSKMSGLVIKGGLTRRNSRELFMHNVSFDQSTREMTAFCDNKMKDWSTQYIGDQKLMPYQIKQSRQSSLDYNATITKYTIKAITNGSYIGVRPPVVVTDGEKYTAISGANSIKASRNTHDMIHSVTIKKNFYIALKKQNFTDQQITAFVTSNVKDTDFSFGKPQSVKKMMGFTYRNSFVPSIDAEKNKNIFKLMARIYNSEALKKALSELFKKDPLSKAKHYEQVTVKGKNKTFTRKQLVGTDSTKDYLEKTRSFSGVTNSFYDYQADQAERIELTPTADIIARHPDIGIFIDSVDPQKKGCYTNSYKLASWSSKIKYVEGVVSCCGGIPIDHAWNEIDGEYFDITADLHENPTLDNYHKTLLLDNQEMLEASLLTETYGPYLMNRWRDYLKKDRINKMIKHSDFKDVYNQISKVIDKELKPFIDNYNKQFVIEGKSRVRLKPEVIHSFSNIDDVLNNFPVSSYVVADRAGIHEIFTHDTSVGHRLSPNKHSGVVNEMVDVPIGKLKNVYITSINAFRLEARQKFSSFVKKEAIDLAREHYLQKWSGSNIIDRSVYLSDDVVSELYKYIDKKISDERF